MSWTNERTDKATKLAGEGASASEIAAAIGGGLTRNAVIGKLTRLKVPLGTRGKQSAAKPRKNSRATRLVERKARAKKPKPAPVHYLQAIEATDLPDDASPCACTLMELTADTCRWPMGTPGTPEFRFCGAKPFATQPYCARHCATAFQGPRRAMSEEEREQRARTARANMRARKA